MSLMIHLRSYYRRVVQVIFQLKQKTISLLGTRYLFKNLTQNLKFENKSIKN